MEKKAKKRKGMAPMREGMNAGGLAHRSAGGRRRSKGNLIGACVVTEWVAGEGDGDEGMVRVRSRV